jgi:hypothetical protein
VNAEGSGLLGHLQMLDQPRGLLAETFVIRWESLREHMVRPESEVLGDGNTSRVQDRKQAPELVIMSGE